MAAQEKCYYPWECWNKAMAGRDIHFVASFFNRENPRTVSRAILSVPDIRIEEIDGQVFRLYYRKDVRAKSDGTVYSKEGVHLPNFDLNLSQYGEAE